MSDQFPVPSQQKPKGKKWRLPILIGFILLIPVTLLWWTQNKRESRGQKNRIDLEAAKLAAYIEADIQNRVPSIRRIVSRWEIKGGTPQDEFIYDAQSYIFDLPGIQAIAWVDDSYHVRWVVPFIGNEQALGLDLASEESRRIALEQAKYSEEPTMTSPMELVQGGMGFSLYFPIYIKDRFDGFILAVFDIEEWLDHLFSVGADSIEREHFRVAVSIDQIHVFEQAGWGRDTLSHLESNINLEIRDHTFTVSTRPTEAFLKNTGTPLQELTALVGFVLAVMVSIIVSLFQRASRETQRSHSVNESLKIEVEERKKAEHQLATERRRLSDILEGTNIGTWEWNVQTGEAIFNERWAEIIGYTLSELSPVSIETWMKFAHPDDLNESDRLLQQHFEGKSDYYEFETRMKHKNGSWIWVLDRGKVATWSDDGKPLLMSGTHADITARKNSEEKIRHLATHDALTDLPGLRLTEDRITMAVSNAKRKNLNAAVMFIDLDGFKAVNDTHGHDAGDSLLIEVGRRLSACVRETDTVARVGGDEFLVVLTELESKDGAARIAEKIIEQISRPHDFKGTPLTVGTSIGIGLYPENGDDPDSLIKNADNAMYKIKKSGKNNYSFAD